MLEGRPYYQEIKTRLFGDADWKALYQESRGQPRVHFQLSREFNDTSCFVVYDFLVELYQNFGKPFHPVDVVEGCVSVVARLDEVRDSRGRDFRHLMLTDPAYHDIFRRYDVDLIYLHGFPIVHNSDYHRFKTNKLGIPQPH